MKRMFLLAGIVLAGVLSCAAQNAIPVVSNIAVNHNPAANSVTYTFDVSDAEGDPVDLQLRVSDGNGFAWLVGLDSITGDTGYPIVPGNGKSITWVYDPAVLAQSYGPGPVNFIGRVIADDRMPVDIQDIVDQVDSLRIVQRLLRLEGVRNRNGNPGQYAAARDSIQQWLLTNDMEDWSYSFFQNGIPGRNISGRLSGLRNEAKTWAASGHYDTVTNAPGVDDNGTGTVGTLEAATVLSNYQFANSVRFFCFDLEEDGLLGSRNYVLNEIQPWESFAGLLNMEMIGYKDDAVNTQSLPAGFNVLFPAAYAAVQADSFRGNFLTNVANVASDPLKTAFDSCAATYVPGLRIVSLAAPGNSQMAPDLRRSDHAPFWDAGYQALMLTDAADLRNPNYHTPADTFGTLDLHFLVQNIRAVVATLAKQAQPLHASWTAGTPFTVNVPVGLAEAQGQWLRAYPNPTSGAVRLEFAGFDAQEARLMVRDVQGRVVRTLGVDGGSGQALWDGRAENGQEVPSGTYFLAIEGDGKRAAMRVSVLR